MFASQRRGLVDEAEVVDDRNACVVSDHHAGKAIEWPPAGIRIVGHRTSPGRYFKVANPGSGWDGTDLEVPLRILGELNPANRAQPGPTLQMATTTGEKFGYYVLDEALEPQAV